MMIIRAALAAALTIVLLLGGLFSPLAAEAQQVAKVARIGYLAADLAVFPHSNDDYRKLRHAFPHREGCHLRRVRVGVATGRAHMHAAIASTPKGPLFYWNVDQAVGRNGGNKSDDVLFVTWCFYKLAKWPHIPPELRDAIGKLPARDHCSGRDGDPIVDGIKALQRQFGLMVDGRVSPVTKDATYAYGGGRSTFLILYPLNAVLAQMHSAQWLRIDLMPEFVWQIKDHATAPFIWG